MENRILTIRELEVINKRINHGRLNQLDSNILTKSVRPKLREMSKIDSKSLLERLNYSPLSRIIEQKIKKLVLENIRGALSVILFGSAIQTGYTSYNDIDVLVITKNKIWENQLDKYKMIRDLKEKAKKVNLNLDIEIISKKSLSSYSYNPTLIYQLKDHKQIYGKIRIPKKILLSKLDLRMKLDWSNVGSSDPEAIEIYRAIRNTILVKLLLNKIIDNRKLYLELVEALGRDLIIKLKQNNASKIDKIYALDYLNNLIKTTRMDIINAKWEKIEL
jgi:predicted nucleotidyltransferase